MAHFIDRFSKFVRQQSTHLRVRLTLLVLLIAGLLLIITVGLILELAQQQMNETAYANLRLTNSALVSRTGTWLDLGTRALHQIAMLPDMVSMDPARQKPILQAMQTAYPFMYLVSTTDLNGLNVARSDNLAPVNYADRAWFQGARRGDAATLQSLTSRANNLPALVVGVPIWGTDHKVVGSAMFAASFVTLAREVNASKLGETGFAYIVDAQNLLIAHPDTNELITLTDFSDAPPVAAARQGQTGIMQYKDASGINWYAFASTTDWGWVIVVQQQASELRQSIRLFQQLAGSGFLIALALLAVLSWVIIGRFLTPITHLTETATAIAGGDLSREAPVVRDDEIGTLARSFNAMTQQLRGLINNLEQRVTERTAELAAAVREAKEASRLKDEFLSIMSHELRTPLNAIIGYLGIMTMQGELTEENLHMTQRTRANAERLLSLINDVLDISRIEAGRLTIVPSAIALRDLVARVQNQMAVLADDKRLDFSVTVDASVPETVWLDEDAITKILTNLLGNAFKFTDTGTVSLVVRQDQDSLLVAVQDTGIGIPAHMHEVIFERFRQVDGSSKRAHGGSGLGLAIVRSLCLALNGKVQVDSEPGKGSTFTVTLPLVQVEQEQTNYVAA